MKTVIIRAYANTYKYFNNEDKEVMTPTPEQKHMLSIFGRVEAKEFLIAVADGGNRKRASENLDKRLEEIGFDGLVTRHTIEEKLC